MELNLSYSIINSDEQLQKVKKELQEGKYYMYRIDLLDMKGYVPYTCQEILTRKELETKISICVSKKDFKQVLALTKILLESIDAPYIIIDSQ